MKLVPALGWDRDKQGGFAEAVASDMAGNVWVGTEGDGLWEYDAAKKTWSQFTTKDGLGDNCIYALAVDQENRVWAGHLNHGVSVYNGKEWKNYGLVDGPLGDHVFAIAVSPKDGDIWMATDMGLARYSEQRKDWDYYTRASGLPADQIQCLAFDEAGNIYAGTQCNGIATAAPGDDFAKWHDFNAPASIPAASEGDSLPSDQINCLAAVHTSGWRMMAGTPLGLAMIGNHPMGYLRGEDWKEHTPGPYNNADSDSDDLLDEDWVTAFAESGEDWWLGYRKSGVECQGNFAATVPPPSTVMIRSILALPDRQPLFAAYGKTAGGLLTLDATSAWAPIGGGTAVLTASPLPAPATVPALDDARAFGAQLGKLSVKFSPGEACYLADDWRTEGDWAGHYGSGFAKLCGMANGDEDYALEPGYNVTVGLGPNHVSSVKAPGLSTDQYPDSGLHSLYSLKLGHRQDADDNDWSYKKRVYPETYDGPDLWVHVTVPDGIHRLSVYFDNFDVHNGPMNNRGSGNKYRDYDLQLVADDPNPAKVQAATPLAQARVNDFWGGVYKQFLVCGPGKFVVKIGRNRSFGTKVQGIFLDRVAGHQPENPGKLPGFDSVKYRLPDEPKTDLQTPLVKAAVALWGELDASLAMRGAVPLQIPFHLWCYRAAVAGNAPPDLLARWRWELGIWNDEDRRNFDDAMKPAHGVAAQ